MADNEMEKSELTRSGFMPARVVHLHPSRFCNLTCKHCYSSSSPNERTALAPGRIILALELLRSEGYEVVSLSGGEPLLYEGFEAVVQAAHTLGFQINLITNGAPIGGHLLELISRYIDLIAISLDGAPETHNDIRGDKHAFSYVERAVDRLSKLGLRYGLSFCISKRSLADMPWAFDYGQANQVSLLQFHPFAATGRGRSMAQQLSLSQEEMARAYVISKLLEAQGGSLIQLDIAPVAAARARRSDYMMLSEEVSDHLLSDLVSPLVIEETGRIIPFSYGISPDLAIGNLGPDLSASIEEYKAIGWHKLRDVLNLAFQTLDSYDGDFIDWFYHIVRASFIQQSTVT